MTAHREWCWAIYVWQGNDHWLYSASETIRRLGPFDDGGEAKPRAAIVNKTYTKPITWKHNQWFLPANMSCFPVSYPPPPRRWILWDSNADVCKDI